ncbi:ABC transporter permease [Cryobacterium sp. Hh7]|uniref:ABC transporter permease n=1 Tax=Cryobacterium sp. Hh7 TaxID=1259159 RepID=UPI00106A94FC|nr:ABC transporter permease [Cryobacterium sp. Hh7]TFD59711.1 ABC transporter permease [Cryobacterium sp. Hh7]
MTSSTVSPEALVEERSTFLGRVTGSPLIRLVTRRLLVSVLIVWVISAIVFALLAAMPGDVARNQAGMGASDEQVEDLRRQLGLDQPPITRYLTWLFAVFRGDFGNSLISGQPISTLVAERLPVTMELVLLAFVISLAIALPVAVLAARKPGGFFDRVVMVISMILLALPNYVLALLLVVVFAVLLRMLPAIGYVPLSEGIIPNLVSVALPVAALATPLVAFYTRFLRGDLVEVMNSEDYVETARSKGAGPWRVLWQHAFRNSSFGMLTIVGLNVGGLVGGTVIIEQIFAMPGLGVMLLQGALSGDSPVVLVCVIIFAAVAVGANLVVDLMYAVLDPRIRYGSH